MAIKINFDSNYNAESPTLVLAKRNGDKIGLLSNVDNINLKDCMNDVPEMSLTVHKYNNDVLYPYWDEIKDFRLVWCKEWDMWFQLTVDINISDETIKNVSLIRLAEAELSQTNLYGVEINTELDISRDDYTEPTIVYNAENHSASLLHRILEKAPHYSLRHVDISLAKIQRTFEFDDIAITDALQEIAEEIHALIIYHSNTTDDGKIARQVSLYDLESNCLDCEHRGEFTNVCPECGSENINEGYGEDTTICIDDENVLGTDITLEVDTDSVKNCFKLVTGDDLLTATVVNCNPNGSGYLWYFSDDIKQEMSNELKNKISSYDALYLYYKDEYQADISNDILNEYNSLVDTYKRYNQELESIISPIVGYSNLMNSHYNTIDLNLFLESGLAPSIEAEDTDAQKQVELLTSYALSPIAVNNIDNLTVSVANTSVLGMAKLLVHPQYKVSIVDSSLEGTTWIGNFKVINKDNDDDAYIGNNISVVINEDYLTFVNQKLDKTLGDYYKEFDTSIDSLFNKNLDSFKKDITEYSLNGLASLHDACQSCLDIMIEQGISDKENEFYDTLYYSYYQKLMALEDEIEVRENAISIVTEVQNSIIDIKNNIQDDLDFEKYLGLDLWHEFCSFRREDTYENDNYISDGLNNAELFKKALEFIEVAEKDIYKSANLQHKITATLKNLLTIKEFAPLVEYFSCGNWLRIKIDDTIYKLRLLEYNIDFDNLSNIDVTFSDVVNGSDGISDTKSILEQASSIATSYDSVKRQASQGADSLVRLDDWVKKGLDATTVNIVNRGENQTQSWDSHGMLYRQYDDITESYLDTQLKIINCGLYITDDNWESTRTGIGKFTYFDPKETDPTKVYKEGYGVIAETICSNLILSEEVGIYTTEGDVVINNKGISVGDSEGKTTVTITNDGKLTCTGADIKGDIYATSLTLGEGVKISGMVTPSDLDGYVRLNVPYDDGYYQFEVSEDGFLQASNAYIQGTLYSSNIVGCKINVTSSLDFLHGSGNSTEIVGTIYKAVKDLVGENGSTSSSGYLCIDTSTTDDVSLYLNGGNYMQLLADDMIMMRTDGVIVTSQNHATVGNITIGATDGVDIYDVNEILINSYGKPSGYAQTVTSLNDYIATLSSSQKSSLATRINNLTTNKGVININATDVYIGKKASNSTTYIQSRSIYLGWRPAETFSAMNIGWQVDGTYLSVISQTNATTTVFGYQGDSATHNVTVFRGYETRLACGGQSGTGSILGSTSGRGVISLSYDSSNSAYGFRPMYDNNMLLGSKSYTWKAGYFGELYEGGVSLSSKYATSDLIATKAVTSSSFTCAKSSTKSVDITCSMSGYTLVGFVGYNISGTNSSYMNITSVSSTASSNTITVFMRNVGSADGTNLTVTVKGIFIKN